MDALLSPIALWDGCTPSAPLLCGMDRPPLFHCIVGWMHPCPISLWDGYTPCFIALWDGCTLIPADRQKRVKTFTFLQLRLPAVKFQFWPGGNVFRSSNPTSKLSMRKSNSGPGWKGGGGEIVLAYQIHSSISAWEISNMKIPPFSRTWDIWWVFLLSLQYFCIPCSLLWRLIPVRQVCRVYLYAYV